MKVEQEIRHIPTREREWQIDRLVGLVRSLAATDEGRASWPRSRQPTCASTGRRPPCASDGASARSLRRRA